MTNPKHDTPPRRRGRPVQADALRHTFRCRCDRDQVDAWVRAAEAEGVTVSEWARRVLDRAASKWS